MVTTMIMDAAKTHWAMLTNWLGKNSTKKIIITCGLTGLLIRMFQEFYMRNRLKRRLGEKQKKLKQGIDEMREKISSLNEPVNELLSLTELNLIELRQRMANRSLTPKKLLHAFQLKALRLFDTGNSGISEFIREAEQWADSLMSSQADENLPNRSPLHGIPVSIKENISVAGYDSTVGLIKRCNQPNKKDCVLVRVLKAQGAIPFVLTTTSQAARSMCGTNAIFGDAKNPYGNSRISGGSSCGEGVLLAQRCSPIGFGTDIAGSIRIPAAFCGLASLKPTSQRLSSLGMTNIAEHSLVCLQACVGPMGRTVSDLAFAMRTLLTPAMFNLDPNVPPLPFDETAYKGDDKKSLCIGYYDNLDDPFIIQTVPVIRKNIQQAVMALEKAGHRVVRFQPPNPSKARDLFMRLLFADGGRELRSWLAYEPICPQIRFVNFVLGLPNWVRGASDLFLAALGPKPAAICQTLGGARNVQAAIDLFTEVRKYRQEFSKAWEDAGPLDAIVCPVSAYPAPPSSARPMFISPSVVYTGLYNLLEYPAGTVPTGFADEADEKECMAMSSRPNPNGSWYGSKIASMQKGIQGLPVVVQVVGQPFREETVLRIMRTIEASRSSDRKD
ncbi:unnamed protein product [Calicophoron daubneyi]|uniref:Amidase domain-containing protein n=1 Tax=Calicophoron daubneyi TaxID=300641 RepID=A0AAV2TTD4_CALDB